MFRSLTVVLVLASFVSAQPFLNFPTPSNSTAKPSSVYIEEGVGIAGVTIGQSTMSDVVAAYGDKYKLIEHNEYSFEIRYADLGLAFWYCRKDREKKIFCIEVKSPCFGVTSKGLVIGESTTADVVRIYGEPEANFGGAYQYKGIQFYYESEPQQEEGTPEPPSKIISVDIVPPDKAYSFCDGV